MITQDSRQDLEMPIWQQKWSASCLKDAVVTVSIMRAILGAVAWVQTTVMLRQSWKLSPGT